MKVLSLFDGISGGRESLKQCNIPVEEYIAFEINKNSIKVALDNHPDIKEKGNVINADFSPYKGFDLLIGGSPCQDFSTLNRYKEGLEGTKSSLFYEYLRALKEVKPKYFFLENVYSMGKKNAQLLTNLLKEVRNDVNLYYIDSKVDGPMNRRRYYWTNIPLTERKENDSRVLKDVLIDKIEIFPYKSGKNKGLFNWSRRNPKTINEKICTIPKAVGSSPCFILNNKSYICGVRTTEGCFGFPLNYCKAVNEKIGISLLGDGWCLYTINRFFENLKEK